MLPSVWSEPFSREIIDKLKIEGAERFRHHQLPESAEEWSEKRQDILAELKQKLNIRIDHELALDCRYAKGEEFGNYIIKQVCFQSCVGRYVTASLFVPKGEGPFPGVVFMHGHNNEGRLGAKNQLHCHALAKTGYVVLFVDAFGSGERSSVHGEFEYHGGMLGGMLLNIGEALMGIQIIDNMRAVDLLCSLPCVDSGRIGATGSSGGGNQTMYLAAFDERVKAAVPVVSVGSYQSYIGGTNCICELIPDGLEICEESALIAMVAPRAIMLCNALHDINPTFYVSEMMRTYTEAQKVFTALGCSEKLRNMGFNGPHSYPGEVEAAMIGFFDFYLKNIGHAHPVTVPEAVCQLPEQIMFFKKGERAPEVSSIPEYIQMRAEEFKKTAAGTELELAEVLHVDKETYKATYLSSEKGWQKYTIKTSRGRLLPFMFKRGRETACRILAAPRAKAELEEQNLIQKAEESGDSILIFDPWGCGECGYIRETLNILIEQHQLSRALMWLGRRLMGEWCMDFLCAIDFAKQQLPDASLHLTGIRDSALAALYAIIITSQKVEMLDMIDFPATLVRKEENNISLPVSGLEYVATEYFTMALGMPGILKWGDVDYAMKLAKCKINAIRPRNLNGSLI
jgi:acetyl xylan esterase AXE1